MTQDTGRLALTVSPDQAGTRLDRFLADQAGSRAAAQGLIEAGQVRVNGMLRPKRHLLHAGDVVQADGVGEPDAAEVGEGDSAAQIRGAGGQADFSVTYEDEHLLIVDKPAGVVVHPARGHQTGTLAQALAGRVQGGQDFRAGIVHRLDRDTSGLLVVAKSDAVHRALKALLAARRLTREYAALVDGHPGSRTGTIEAPIGRDRRDRVRISLDTDSPRPARTHFEVVRLLPTSTLLAVRLETGRTHQIRVHMAAVGHPISGDPVYGVAGRFGLERQFLHAEHLAFVHPVTGELIDVRSALPADLKDALERAAE
jgi:23S rRNA pseudouridine1911/1915/1917 synthase